MPDIAALLDELNSLSLLALLAVLGASVLLLSLASVCVWSLRILRGRRALSAKARWRGAVGRVALDIPATGVGRVSFVTRSGRVHLPARELHGHAIAAGTEVLIVDLDGRIAEVCPYSPGD